MADCRGCLRPIPGPENEWGLCPDCLERKFEGRLARLEHRLANAERENGDLMDENADLQLELEELRE